MTDRIRKPQSVGATYGILERAAALAEPRKPVVVTDGRGWPLDIGRDTKLDTSNPDVRAWLVDMWHRRGPVRRAR